LVGTYDFGTSGNSVPVTGVSGDNAVIVKYNSSGVAQWAESEVTAPSDSYFNGVSVDPSSGNIYAVGQIDGTGTFDFGNKCDSSREPNQNNTLIVKYSVDGSALWVNSASPAPNASQFAAVSADPSSGNIYAVGNITGNGTFVLVIT